jgi:hypothetical protein
MNLKKCATAGTDPREVANWSRRATEPYGRWFGGRELETPAYPITPSLCIGI